MSGEFAARARLLAALRADRAVLRLVHGVHDGEPVRAAPPWLAVGSATSEDWGTKDRPGREARVSLTLAAQQDDPPDAAAAAVEALVAALPAQPQTGGAHELVAARVIRTRLSRTGSGEWRMVWDIRLRLLAVTGAN